MAIRALLVDDSELACDVLRLRLEQLGCDVVGQADCAAQGLELFRKLQPDLIVLDLILRNMEQMDAQELFRLIRKESPETVAIIVSARPKASQRESFMREGALAYFEKPFIDVQALGAVLSQAFPEVRLRALRTSTRRL